MRYCLLFLVSFAFADFKKQGDLAFGDEQYNQAEKAYKNALKNDSLNKVYLHQQILKCAILKNNFKQALLYLETIDDKNFPISFQLLKAQIFLYNKMYQEAFNLLEKIYKKKLSKTALNECINLLVNACIGLKQYAKACVFLEKQAPLDKEKSNLLIELYLLDNNTTKAALLANTFPKEKIIYPLWLYVISGNLAKANAYFNANKTKLNLADKKHLLVLGKYINLNLTNKTQLIAILEFVLSKEIADNLRANLSLKLIQAYYEAKDFTKVVELCNAFLQKNIPILQENCQLILADALVELKQYKQAKQVYNKVLQHTKNSLINIKIAQVLLQEEAYLEAIEALKSIDSYKTSITILNQIADNYFFLAQNDNKYYSSASQYYNLSKQEFMEGYCYFLAQDFAKASKVFKLLNKTKNKDKRSSFLYALSLKKAKQYNNALQSFKLYQEQYPVDKNFIASLFHCVEIFSLAKQEKQKNVFLSSFNKHKNPIIKEYLLFLDAYFYFKSNDFIKANALLQKMSKNTQNFSSKSLQLQTYLYLGIISDNSISKEYYYRKIASLFPASLKGYQAYYHLAKLALFDNNLIKCQELLTEHFSDLTTINDKELSFNVQFLQAELLIQQGNLTKALQILQAMEQSFAFNDDYVNKTTLNLLSKKYSLYQNMLGRKADLLYLSNKLEESKKIYQYLAMSADEAIMLHSLYNVTLLTMQQYFMQEEDKIVERNTLSKEAIASLEKIENFKTSSLHKYYSHKAKFLLANFYTLKGFFDTPKLIYQDIIAQKLFSSKYAKILAEELPK